MGPVVVVVIIFLLIVGVLVLMSSAGPGTLQLEGGYSLELPPGGECSRNVHPFVVLRGPNGRRLTNITIGTMNTSQGREWPNDIPYSVRLDAAVCINQHRKELVDGYRRRAG